MNCLRMPHELVQLNCDLKFSSSFIYKIRFDFCSRWQLDNRHKFLFTIKCRLVRQVLCKPIRNILGCILDIFVERHNILKNVRWKWVTCLGFFWLICWTNNVTLCVLLSSSSSFCWFCRSSENNDDEWEIEWGVELIEIDSNKTAKWWVVDSCGE